MQYLHSAVIQTRAYPRTNEGRKLAIQIGTFDSTCSLIVSGSSHSQSVLADRLGIGMLRGLLLLQLASQGCTLGSTCRLISS